MSLLSRLFSRHEEKASSVGSMLWASTLGRPAFPKRDAAQLAQDGYRQAIIAYACIRLVSEAVACLVADADLYQQSSGQDEDTEIENHPILDLLSMPNPDQDGHEFLADLLTAYLISGNAYAEQIIGVGGRPVELWTLRSDRMRVVPGPDGRAIGYEYGVSGQVRQIPRYEDQAQKIQRVLHLKTPNPLDDWYGMSPLEPAGFSIDVHSGAGALLKALIDNSARPSGAFKFTGAGNLAQEQFDRLKSEINEKFSGARNAGRPLILDGTLDWVQMGMSVADMQTVELRNDMARDIARAVGVPSLLLGIPGDNTFANYTEANKALYRETVMPLASRVCRAFSRWLLPPGLYLAYDEDDIPALADERQAKWTAVQGADFLTINEKREALGYEAIDGGEVLLIPATMSPLADAGLMPEGGPGSSTADDPMDEEDDGEDA